MKTERVAIGKRTFPLAVDLNAPTAMLIARERPERLGFARVINPQKYADTVRLTQLQQFDPDADACDFRARLARNRSELGPNDRRPPQ